MGAGTTTIVQDTANTGIFVLDSGSDQSAIRRLNFSGTGTTNYAIQIGVAGPVSDCVVEDCAFGGTWYSNVQLVYAINSTRIVGNILGGGTHAIEVGPNSGTPMITNNTGAGTISAVHINQCVGGGYIVEGNYFDGGQYAFLYTCNASAPDLDLYFVGNHIEDYTVSAMKFVSAAGGPFVNLIVVGNEFANAVGTTGPTIATDTTGSGIWLERLTIVGNVFVDNTTGVAPISLYRTQVAVISGNTFAINGTAGIVIDSSCANCTIDYASNAGLAYSTDSQAYKYANLTAPANAGLWARGWVSDGSTATFGNVVTGGGSYNGPVYCEGTNWRVG